MSGPAHGPEACLEGETSQVGDLLGQTLPGPATKEPTQGSLLVFIGIACVSSACAGRAQKVTLTAEEGALTLSWSAPRPATANRSTPRGSRAGSSTSGLRGSFLHTVSEAEDARTPVICAIRIAQCHKIPDLLSNRCLSYRIAVYIGFSFSSSYPLPYLQASSLLDQEPSRFRVAIHDVTFICGGKAWPLIPVRTRLAGWGTGSPAA